jgi:hypothetical protein
LTGSTVSEKNKRSGIAGIDAGGLPALQDLIVKR